jgi:hypothetical protein
MVTEFDQACPSPSCRRASSAVAARPSALSTLDLNFRYSEHSRASRECGKRLLELTPSYDDLVVERRLGVFTLAVLALVARARHLLQGAYAAADRGDPLAAAILTRGLTESVLLLAWLNKDPELGEAVWMLDDIRTTLSHHKEVADEERRQRRRARRAGQDVESVAPGRSLGLLNRAAVRLRRRLQAETTERMRNLPRQASRLRRLKVSRTSHLPSFADRAKVADMPWVYSLAYRFDSNAAAHPMPLSLGRFLEDRPEGIEIRPTPGGSFPDPYYVPARLFAALLALAGERVDQSQLIRPGLDEVVARLDELSASIQASDAGQIASEDTEFNGA